MIWHLPTLLCLACLLLVLVRRRQWRAAARERLTPEQWSMLWSDGW